MRRPDDNDDLDDDAESREDDTPGEDAPFETEADVVCPHCGKTMTIALDPAGGASQEYVEDCEVCCRPSRVRLWYDARGAADVEIQPVE